MKKLEMQTWDCHASFTNQITKPSWKPVAQFMWRQWFAMPQRKPSNSQESLENRVFKEWERDTVMTWTISFKCQCRSCPTWTQLKLGCLARLYSRGWHAPIINFDTGMLEKRLRSTSVYHTPGKSRASHLTLKLRIMKTDNDITETTIQQKPSKIFLKQSPKHTENWLIIHHKPYSISTLPTT